MNFEMAQHLKGLKLAALTIMMRKPALAVICAIAMFQTSASRAQQATEIRLTYSKGQFQPSQVSAPADKPISFRIKNLDAKAMEFESTALRVEKVVAAGSEGVINVRALKPGRYEFYDDFNDKARGALTVQ
jgi:Cupredoxin-like domain